MVKDKNFYKLVALPVAVGVIISLLPYLILFESVREPLFEAGFDENIDLLLNVPLIVGSFIVGTAISLYYLKSRRLIIRILAILVIALIFHQLSMLMLSIYNTVTMIPLGPI